MNIECSSFGKFILKWCCSYFYYSTYHISVYMAMKFSKEFFSVFNLLSLLRNRKGRSSVLDLSEEMVVALIINYKVSFITFRNCVIDTFLFVCWPSHSNTWISSLRTKTKWCFWNCSWCFVGSKNMCWFIGSGVHNKLISLTWVECPKRRWNL